MTPLSGILISFFVGSVVDTVTAVVVESSPVDVLVVGSTADVDEVVVLEFDSEVGPAVVSSVVDVGTVPVGVNVVVDDPPVVDCSVSLSVVEPALESPHATSPGATSEIP